MYFSLIMFPLRLFSVSVRSNTTIFTVMYGVSKKIGFVFQDIITECDAHHGEDLTEKVFIPVIILYFLVKSWCQVSRDMMAPHSSFSPLRDGMPDMSCEEEDDISYRLEPLPQPGLPPPPCRPFSATSLSHKRSVRPISWEERF